ncbi:MAG: hypothetical protein ABJE47_12570 [bacterium]
MIRISRLQYGATRTLLALLVSLGIPGAHAAAQSGDAAKAEARARANRLIGELTQMIRRDTAHDVIPDLQREELGTLLATIMATDHSPLAGNKTVALQAMIAKEYPLLAQGDTNTFVAVLFERDGHIARHTTGSIASQRRVDLALASAFPDLAEEDFEMSGYDIVPVAPASPRRVTVYWVIKQ